eukprot:5406514-Lingulodinium_polyedra.AAC.1
MAHARVCCTRPMYAYTGLHGCLLRDWMRGACTHTPDAAPAQPDWNLSTLSQRLAGGARTHTL